MNVKYIHLIKYEKIFTFIIILLYHFMLMLSCFIRYIIRLMFSKVNKREARFS